MLDQTQLIALLKQQIKDAGSQKTLAHRWGISQQYLTDVLKRRRMPNRKILDALGYESVVMYKKIYHTEDKPEHGAEMNQSNSSGLSQRGWGTEHAQNR